MTFSRTIFAGIKVCAGLTLLLAAMPRPAAQDEPSHFRVNVVLVQLSIAVTDNKGNYVTGLRPEDFTVLEDNISQKISSFDDGNQPSSPPVDTAQSGDSTTPPGTPLGTPPGTPPGTVKAERAPSGAHGTEMTHTLAGVTLPGLTGASVFILFDTSNYMYRGFVYAQDAITDFIRTMPDASKIAFYSYSRDLSRGSSLTADRFRVVNGVRSTVAGDDAALYNSLLLTVKDAAPLRGRKAIVVFSNGPDNASSVPPEDVAELAQSTGTIIYIVSTRQAETEPISSAAFERMSRATGGKAYFARNWRQEKDAFASIKDDLSHLYTISYYPQMNPNRGWRGIKVQLMGKNLEKYHIRTRDGYNLQKQSEINTDNDSALVTEPEPK